MVRSDFICDVMVIYDDIMYQEANKALLPDSLATLTNEFSGKLLIIFAVHRLNI